MNTSGAMARSRPRLLSPKALPLPRPPRWALIAIVVGGAVSLVGHVIRVDGFTDLFGLALVVGSFRLGAWLESTAYAFLARQGPLARLVFVGGLPMLGFGLWVIGFLALIALSPIDREVFGAAGNGPLTGIVGGITVPMGAWVIGASLGSISITVIDVVVSGLVQGFRARITLAIGLLVSVLSAVLGAIVYGADTLQQQVQRWREIEGLSIDVDTPEQRQLVESGFDFLANNPWALTLSAVGLSVMIGLPSVISACTKLADAVLERILPLMHAFDHVAEGARDVRVEEAGSRELTELARHINRMVENVDTGERMERAFGMYVGDKLLDRIKTHHADGRVPPTTKDATVWFADIRGFTTLSEQLDPQVVVDVLNRYFDEVLEVIDAHDGFLDKFIGDAVVVIFNGPVDQPDHATRGVRCAAAMLQAVHALNARDAFPEIGALQVGAGVNSGPMVAGNIGSSRKVEYTVIGDAVNLASRVEGMTKQYGAPLLITGATRERLLPDHGLAMRRTDRVAVKGKAKPVDLYEVLDGQPDDERARRLAGRDDYERAFDAYLAGDLELAIEGFERVLKQHDGDGAAQLLLARCRQLKADGLPEPWDGVLRMTSK